MSDRDRPSISSSDSRGVCRRSDPLEKQRSRGVAAQRRLECQIMDDASSLRVTPSPRHPGRVGKKREEDDESIDKCTPAKFC